MFKNSELACKSRIYRIIKYIQICIMYIIMIIDDLYINNTDISLVWYEKMKLIRSLQKSSVWFSANIYYKLMYVWSVITLYDSVDTTLLPFAKFLPSNFLHCKNRENNYEYILICIASAPEDWMRNEKW